MTQPVFPQKMTPYPQQQTAWPAAQQGGWSASGQPVWNGRQWVHPPKAPQWGTMPAFNPQFGPSFPQPPKKPSTTVNILAAIVGSIIGVLSILVIASLLDKDDPAPPPPITTGPTVPTSTTQPTGPTSTTTTGPGGEYINDGYNVPAPGTNAGVSRPEPHTWDEATHMLSNNALYNGITMPAPVRCELATIDTMTASTTELKAYFDQLTECLMRAWDPTLQQAGFYAVRPIVNIYSTEIESPCGPIPTENAVFCSANEQVYYATDLARILPAQTRGIRMVAESVIGHEFGHAVQNRIGVLPSGNAWSSYYESEGDLPTANQYSRWMELQADCFAGQFLKSISQSIQLTQEEADAVALAFYAIGDDVLTGDPNYDGNHGHGQSRVNWLSWGFNNDNLDVCNTFIAAASETV